MTIYTLSHNRSKICCALSDFNNSKHMSHCSFDINQTAINAECILLLFWLRLRAQGVTLCVCVSRLQEKTSGKDFRKRLQEETSGKDFRKRLKERTSGKDFRKGLQEKTSGKDFRKRL